MLDTMTFTKVLGGFCGALLIFLLGKWAAEGLYHVGGGHGDEAQAYAIEVADAGDSAGGAEEVDFATLMASADLAKGEKVFGKCRACHKLEDGANATGPFLYGVVGRAIDAVDGFAYSGALEQVGDAWTPENLSHFLENPRAAAPGTAMSFAGLSSAEDRANLIAYLDATDD
ncbi:c-type cytochrome [Puniceibacterium confluentis]|uniref:c-type cytochrome n=1 Tax=Puniceibacterium confluentis TaxID=1958944 RepID=UPI0011B7DDC1|nr:cytochrome c family protein [Puniceibacterium confluentis]